MSSVSVEKTTDDVTGSIWARIQEYTKPIAIIGKTNKQTGDAPSQGELSSK